MALTRCFDKLYAMRSVELFRSWRAARGVRSSSIILVHIGKCGGRTVRDGIENSSVYTDIKEIHGLKAPYRKDCRYIFVIRGPISRLESAFQWRYKLVVTQGAQLDRFPGEYEVLAKYKTLNGIAECLYDSNGVLDRKVAKDIRKIHHIREDISYYLGELLEKISPSQVEGVLMQESLNEDIARVFGYQNTLRSNDNSKEERPFLSDRSRKNLKRFFSEDYKVLMQLYCWGKIEKSVLVCAI